MIGFSLPRPVGRGAGLGNEVIPWGKAFIGAQELGLRCLHPAWGANSRGYAHEFGTTRLDWIGYRLLRVLPTVTISDELVETTGARFDYQTAIRVLAENENWKRRGPLVLQHQSMAGGYLSISSARHFLQAQTIFTPAAVASAYSEHRQSHALRVVLHVRAGDFSAGNDDPSPGEFNVSIPIDWYRQVAKAIRASFDGAIEMHVLSDTESPELAALRRSVGASARVVRSSLGDLEFMAHADLLVCSISSFSLLAAFLSNSPYIWFGPHLGERSGWLSIWGHEDLQTDGPTQTNSQYFETEPWGRGFAIGWSDENLPRELSSLLVTRYQLTDCRRDLLYYGVIRKP